MYKLMYKIIVFLIFLQLCCTSFVVAAIPAFPGAAGFGANSIGGRGYGSVKSKIIAVDTLKDVVARDGKTSLREAVQFSGPRIIIFRVGGIIFLDKPLEIIEPYITIAGQTAPGPGITLAHHGMSITNGCHDVIIRYLRVRNFFAEGDNGAAMDGLLFYGRTKEEMVDKIIIDHCSFAWAIDENVNSWDYVRRYTIQWSIIAEGAVFGHHKGNHSMGLLSGGKASENLTSGSIHHNLFMHNCGRNPRISDGRIFDVYNNVVYDWSNNNAAAIVSSVQVNFIGNLYVAGPGTSTIPENRNIVSVPDSSNSNIGPRLYIKGNLAPHRPRQTGDEWQIGIGWFQEGPKGHWHHIPAEKKQFALQSPASPWVSGAEDAMTASEKILLHAGTSFPVRDKLDQRLVYEMSNVLENYPDQQIQSQNMELGNCGPGDGVIADVLIIKPANDLRYKKYLPRQYRIAKGQTLKQAKSSHLDIIVKAGRITAKEKLNILNDSSGLFKWEIVKRVIPDANTVSNIAPDSGFPLLLDSDNDGLPDGWENENGLSPRSRDTDGDDIDDGLDDDDGDGYLNIEEYINALPLMNFGNIPQV